jgi:hypothetical protein
MSIRDRKIPTTGDQLTNPLQTNSNISSCSQITMSKRRNPQESKQESHILSNSINGKYRSEHTRKIPKRNNPENTFTRNPIGNHTSIQKTKMIDYEQDIYNNTNSWRKVSTWILKKWRNMTTRRQSYILPIHHEQTGLYRHI